MSISNLHVFCLCLTPNSSYFKFLICLLTKFIMPISKVLIPNSMLCLIPKVLLQCHVFRPFMPNSKGLPTLIRFSILKSLLGYLYGQYTCRLYQASSVSWFELKHKYLVSLAVLFGSVEKYFMNTWAIQNLYKYISFGRDIHHN